MLRCRHRFLVNTNYNTGWIIWLHAAKMRCRENHLSSSQGLTTLRSYGSAEGSPGNMSVYTLNSLRHALLALGISYNWYYWLDGSESLGRTSDLLRIVNKYRDWEVPHNLQYDHRYIPCICKFISIVCQGNALFNNLYHKKRILDNSSHITGCSGFWNHWQGAPFANKY